MDKDMFFELIKIAKDTGRDLQIEIKTDGTYIINYTIPLLSKSTYTSILSEDK